MQTGPHEYDLILKTDYNTSNITQWFYFRVTNMRRHTKYRFNIINLVKPDSLYNEGMRVAMYSQKDVKVTGVGWRRVGSDISYFQNQSKRRNGAFHYTLTYTLQFPYEGDTAYFAHCFPYSYTDLVRYLTRLAVPENRNIVRKVTLAKTTAGNK